MKIRVLLIMLIVTAGLLAEDDLAGTTGFAFLKVNYSARATAMGNAYTALSNQSDAVFFNPAGLGEMKATELTVSYMSYFDEIQTGAVSYAFQHNRRMHLAGFIKYMNGSEPRTLVDANGEFLGEFGTFGFSNTVLGLGGSYYVNDMLTLGANVKFLIDILDDNNASAVAADLGILHQSTNENLKIGLTLRNFGKQLSSYTNSDYSEELPNLFCLGFSYHPQEKLYVNFDVRKPLDGEYSFLVGTEYQAHKLLAFRAGYKTNADDWKAGGDAEVLSGISFGMGFNWQKYLIDYAVASYGDLGMINNISLTYKF